MRRVLLPLLAILITAFLGWSILQNAPQAKKRPPSKAKAINVDVQLIKARDVQLNLLSYGQVSAKTTANLTSQISGRVVKISPTLQDGAFFAAGDLLINLDNRDFQSAINSAKAELTQAQQALTLEKAQVVQAKADWERLNKAIPIPALVSRKPQVVSAKAKVSAALAQFDKALLNFKRTKIYAPFNGRVLNKKVNMGDFISANSTLVEFIASDFLQVRLSLKNSDLAFINLPETGLSNTLNKETLPKVLFESRLIEPQFWNGQIVRTEASIDQSSQQLFVIGEIEAPFGPLNAHKHSLKIGQYITAKIQGKLLKNVISINVDTLHQGQYVYIVKNGLITKTAVDISWQNEKIAIISMGLSIGDKLITSTVSADSEGSQASTGTGTGVGKTKDKKAFKKLNP